MTQQIVPTNLAPVGHEQITDVSLVTALNPPNGAKFAFLQAEDADIRWLDSGTDPSATLGMLLLSGQSPFSYPGDLKKIRFIDDGVTVAILHVSYYGYKGAVK